MTRSGQSDTVETRGLLIYVSDEPGEMWWVRADPGLGKRGAAREVAALEGNYPIAAYVARRIRADVGEEGGEPRIWPTEHGTEEYYEVRLREGAMPRW